MSETKYTWRDDVDSDDWQSVVSCSPHGTIFAEQVYLELAGCTYDRYLIQQGNKIKAGICIVRSADGRSCVLDDLVIHNGILFLHDPTKKPVRQKFEQFEMTKLVIAQLVSRYDQIELALSPQFEDMRPFLWHDYHETDNAKKFIFDLRYTSYLDISDLMNEASVEKSVVFNNMETLRKRHIRSADKKGGHVRIGGNCALLIDYYCAMMAKQGEVLQEKKLKRIRQLVDGLVEHKRALVFEVTNAAGIVVYVTVYAWDSKRAYYLFGAGHPDVSEPWQGTIAHWYAFIELAKTGVREVDMEGVNSPNRGWFKLSFGGELKPYFQVSLMADR